MFADLADAIVWTIRILIFTGLAWGVWIVFSHTFLPARSEKRLEFERHDVPHPQGHARLAFPRAVPDVADGELLPAGKAAVVGRTMRAVHPAGKRCQDPFSRRGS